MTQPMTWQPIETEGEMKKATFVEFGRKPGESDEEWSAACKEFARAYAKATGMEHLLPDPPPQDRSEG